MTMNPIQSTQASQIQYTPLDGPSSGTSSRAVGASALPDPTPPIVPITDLGAELAALIVKSGQTARQQDEQERAADEKAEDKADNAQVAALRQKASDIESEGLVDGLSTMASGALQLGSAVNTAQSSVAPAGSQAAADLKIRAAGFAFQGTLVKGEGDIEGSTYKAAQANDDANATAHSADASRAKRAEDAESDDIKSDRDLISAAVDFYKEYTGTKAQEQAAVAHIA
jgi:hypothetical protein